MKGELRKEQFIHIFSEGLKENPLYISSGETANNSNSLYSVVNKTCKTDKAEKNGNLDQGPVYSEVKKREAKGKCQRKE